MTLPKAEPYHHTLRTSRWDFGGDAIIVSTSVLTSPIIAKLITLPILSEHEQARPPDARPALGDGLALVSDADTRGQLPDRGGIQGTPSPLLLLSCLSS
jgi:hypothetical protein